MNEYVNSFKETKYMLCKMKNGKLLNLEKTWTTWEKHLKPNRCLKEQYFKITLNYSSVKSSIHFFNKEVTPENVVCLCIAVIVLDLFFKIKRNTI